MGGPSRARLEKVVCRVVGCVDKEGNQRTMNRSSYKEHLVLKHPNENCNNPSGYCSKQQPKLDFSKCKKSGSTSQQKSWQEKEQQGQGKGQQEQKKQQEKGQQGHGEMLQEWDEPVEVLQEHVTLESGHSVRLGEQEDDGTMQASQVEDGTMLGSQVEDSTMQASQEEDSTMQASQVKDSTMQASQVKDSTIQASQVKDSTIQASQVKDSTMQASQVEDGTMEASQVDDGTMQGDVEQEEVDTVVGEYSSRQEEQTLKRCRQRVRSQRRSSESSDTRSRSPPRKSRVFRGDSDSSQDEFEMSIEGEGIEEVINNVRNIKNVSFLDLEQVVIEGNERELVKAIEDAIKDDKVKNMGKEDKVIMMSNTQKVVVLENISKEYEERAIAAGMILLSELTSEDWRKVSRAEANLFKRLIHQCTMPEWVRAVFWGLLSTAEEAAVEAEKEAGEKEDLLETVSKKLDIVVKKILVNPPDLGRKSALEKCEAKIDIVEKQLNVSRVAGDLQKAVQQLKEISCVEKSSVITEDEMVTKEALKSCRDVDQISEKISEFHCQGGVICCRLCPDARLFKYTQDLQTRAEHQSIPLKLSNLKGSLQDHLSSDKHKKRIKEARRQEELAEQKSSRNRTIGLKLGKVVYLLAHHGLPFTLYSEMVQLLADFKVDVGDINHSKLFCRDLGPSIAQVIETRTKKHLSTVLEVTGERPPVLLVADKFTYQHWTRQITGGVTLMPGSPALIQAVYFESPKCPSGTGEYMAAKITEVADKWIEPDQYQGSVGDGVYRHCSVPQKLDEHYERKGIDTWDGMHVAATVGTAMRADKKFSWLGIIDDTMGKGNNFINYGSCWHKINEVFELRKAAGEYSSKTLKTPKFNSDTRFENYIYQLYLEFRERYPLLLEVLESTKEEFRLGISTERKKADTADEIQGRMYNSKFNLTLSGMTDVYKPYSIGIQILQTINILPNVKYQNFKRVTVDTYKKMLDTVDIEQCCCTKEGEVDGNNDGDICNWPNLHTDIKELVERGTYRGVPMGQLVEDTNRTRGGHSQQLQNLLLDKEDIIQMVSQRLEEVLFYLSEGLEAKVFDKKTMEELKYLDTLLDSAGLLKKIKSSSPALVSSLMWGEFFQAAQHIDSKMKVDEVELRREFREYCRMLGSLTGSPTSMEIFQLMFDSKNNKYQGTEHILAIVGRAMVSMSVESMAESWISVLEAHSTKTRGLEQLSMETEMMVAVNGPECVYSAAVVEQALSLYWTKAKLDSQKEGHFIRTWARKKQFVVSKAVDSLSASEARRGFLL